MELTEEIENKLRSFDWRYLDEIHDNIFIIKDPKDMNPRKVSYLDEKEICFWTEEDNNYACCMPLCDILIF